MHHQICFKRSIIFLIVILALLLPAASAGAMPGGDDPGTPAYNVWQPLALPSIEGRRFHTTVWTGSRMIVWGGKKFIYVSVGDGSLYDPALDSWTPVASVGAPSERSGHTAVWTGSEMIIWGGFDDYWDIYGYLDDGARYNPVTNSWAPMNNDSELRPGPRSFHSAVWTGTEMIIWGGEVVKDPSQGLTMSVSTGRRYNPTTDSWTEVSQIGAPSARRGHSAIWTGTEMIVWGGWDDIEPLNSGGRYNPATDTWTSLPTSNAPAGRVEHGIVWTGKEMLVWGGSSSILQNNGGRYDPATNTWTPITTVNAPDGLNAPGTVWTGHEMVVWGGGDLSGYAYATGGRYNPATDTWGPLPTTNAPAPRAYHGAVWTGEEMIVWGGGISNIRNDGGRIRLYWGQTFLPLAVR